MDYLFQLGDIRDFAVHKETDGIFALTKDRTILHISPTTSSNKQTQINTVWYEQTRELKGSPLAIGAFSGGCELENFDFLEPSAIAMASNFMFVVNRSFVYRFKVKHSDKFHWCFDKIWPVKLNSCRNLKLSCQADGMVALISDGVQLQWITARSNTTTISRIGYHLHPADVVIIHPTDLSKLYYCSKNTVFVFKTQQLPFTDVNVNLEKTERTYLSDSTCALEAVGSALCHVNYLEERRCGFVTQTILELKTLKDASNTTNLKTMKLDLPSHHYSIPLITHILILLHNLLYIVAVPTINWEWGSFLDSLHRVDWIPILQFALSIALGHHFFVLISCFLDQVLPYNKFLQLSGEINAIMGQLLWPISLTWHICSWCFNFLLQTLSILIIVLSMCTSALTLGVLYIFLDTTFWEGYRKFYAISLKENVKSHWLMKPDHETISIKACCGKIIVKYGNYFFQINEYFDNFWIM